jgi:isocitrate lyase
MGEHGKECGMLNRSRAAEIEQGWEDGRWAGIRRPYTAEDVVRLRGTVRIEHTLARMGAERLWELMRTKEYVASLGAMTGNQAVQQVKAGLESIYLSGWQVAADANLAGQMYPDQSLYPANSGPQLVKAINQALQRADQIHHAEGKNGIYWFAPIGGKVLLPTAQGIRNLISARLAADVMGVPTVIVARTDADSAKLITSDVDPADAPFLTGERTAEGFYRVKAGLDYAIARGLAYAPYADVLWCETSEPNIEEAREFAEAIHEKFPGKLLAYNCSPSFNWKAKLGDEDIATFQKQLGAMGYKYQFVTLAGFHALNYSMFDLACNYKERGMDAYTDLQEAEFAAEKYGYTATKHQREVGAGYFDEVAQVVAGGAASTTALTGSTEDEQFVQ